VPGLRNGRNTRLIQPAQHPYLWKSYLLYCGTESSGEPKNPSKIFLTLDYGTGFSMSAAGENDAEEDDDDRNVGEASEREY
jgi:hypothetical protein